MQIVVHDRIGKPAEVLRVEERPGQAPAAGEVRVRILAAPIHPSDLLKIAGHYGVKPDLPETPGTEAAGEVVETGAGVEDLQAGQKVLIIGGVGTWRSEIVLPADAVIPVPDGDPEQIAMAAANPITAWLLLTDFAELNPGDWIVQSGANSAVGRYVIQLAREMGLKTINVVRREGLEDELTGIGADFVLVDGPDLTGRIKAAAGDAPVRLALDCIAGETFGRLMAAVAKGGTIVGYGAMSNNPVTLEPAALIFSEVSIKGFWLVHWFRETDPGTRAEAFGKLLPLIASGRLRAAVDARFPLERIGEAVARASEKKRNGKVLLVPEVG